MVGSSGHSRFHGFQVPKKLRYITKPLTRDSLGWESFASCPEGGWNKGALTTTFLQFLQHWTQQNDLEHSADERLRLVDSWLMEVWGHIKLHRTGKLILSPFLFRGT